jgi:hypothetical protein
MQNIPVQINLDAPKGELQLAIQRIIYLVSGALNSTYQIEDSQLKLPETDMEVTFASSLEWSPSEVSTQLKNWILQNGFRDGIESLNTFLESIHDICSVWSMIQKQDQGQVLTGKDLKILMESDPKKFHRLGFLDKLAHLRDSHGITVDSRMMRHILSANTARNCLVHRNGLVTEKDSESGRLLVSWRRLKLVSVDEDGERDLLIGVVSEKEEKIVLKIIDEEKIFNIGDSISFSPQEFQYIAWSMFQFSSGIMESLIKWGRINGLIASSAD